MRLPLIQSPRGRADRRSVFRDVPWRWSDVLIGIAPLFAARTATAVMPWAGPASFSAAPDWLWLPLSVLALAWMLTFPLAVMRRRHVALPRLPGHRVVFTEFLFALLAAPLVMVGITITFQVAASLLGSVPSPDDPLETLGRSPHRFDLVALVALAVLVAPVAEESFFRGLLYNAPSAATPLARGRPLASSRLRPDSPVRPDELGRRRPGGIVSRAAL